MPEDPRVSLLLALADDELVIGHRHSEWTGWAPHLEEDLAFSSIAQDEMAHARLLYEIAGPLAGRSADELALGRQPEEYRHAVICERPNLGWGYTVARQYLYDTADDIRLASLEGSSFKDLADVIKTIRLEERYHLEHARLWFGRLSRGPVTARERLAEGLETAIPEAVGLFESIPGEPEAVEQGILPDSMESLLASWLERLGTDLEEVSLDYLLTRHARVGELVPTSSGEAASAATLEVPGIERRDGKWVHVGEFEGTGGRHGKHTEDFLPLWEEMTALYRKVPGATW